MMHLYPSEMAQNLWTAIFAWSSGFIVTVLVSFATAPPDPTTLQGLVYSQTARIDTRRMRWFERPEVLAVFALAAVVTLNVLFW